jgi:hypothetical protein
MSRLIVGPLPWRVKFRAYSEVYVEDAHFANDEMAKMFCEMLNKRHQADMERHGFPTTETPYTVERI